MRTIPAPFSGRVEKLRGLMREKGADVFLCDHAEMLQWLTGYTVSETFYRGCVLPLEGDPIWVLRAVDELPCRASSWISDVVAYPDDADSHAIVAEVIARFSPQRIGADFTSYGFTAHTRDRLSSLLPDAEFVNLPECSNVLRAVKDAGEITNIENAAQIADGAMAQIVRNLSAGMRPRDVSAIAAHYYLTNGADDYWVGPISVSRSTASKGDGMGFLHATFGEDRLNSGDILHVELVPRVSYYSARFMRSVSLGPIGAGDADIIGRMAALQDAQFAAIRPGARARDVDAILRNGFLKEGLRETFPNITGYQVGLYAKTPRSSETTLSLHPGSDWVFEEGMVFHIYATAQGLALSETIVVTENGCRRLTQTPRRMLIAGEAI